MNVHQSRASTADRVPTRTRPAQGSGAVLLGVLYALLLVTAGVTLGVQVVALVHGPSIRQAALANATAPYAAIAASLALVRRSPLRAALDSGMFFVAFVLGYYLTIARQNGVAAIDRHYAGVWLLIAVVVCPVLTGSITWARARRGILRAIVFAVPAAAAIAEAATGHTWGMAGALADAVIACDLAVAAGFLLLLPRGLRTKVAATAWAVPCTLGLGALVEHLAASDAYYRWMY